MAIYFGITTAAKYAIANTYYGVNSHIRAHDWAAETEDDKKAALVQAEREVNLYLGTDMETTFDATSFPVTGNPNFRPDYAIFEHALFILDNTARKKSGSDGAGFTESSIYQIQERDTGVGISPQALRFLTMNRIQISRG